MVTEEKVWEALGGVMDPEVPFSVVDLGLVYGVEVTPPDRVRVQLTLTTRGCPLVRRISDEARQAIAEKTGAREVQVEIVWDPPWNPGMAVEAVRSRFGWQ
ncbi:MAG: metal-sulfur cluster assembly factor [Acidobacteriota bacterium]